MYNSGAEYEKFVANLHQALLDADPILKNETNIQVELNKKITDNCGNEREFDLYWEYELGGLTYKTVIECKDYNRNITIEKIDALIGKIRDIPDLKAVFATKKGYQSGAKTKAEQNKIALLIVREQNNLDWKDADGNPLINKISINLFVNYPATITKFEPHADAKWVNENAEIDVSTPPLNLVGRNDEIFIEDINKNEKYSLYDLANNLTPLGSEEFGSFSKNEKLSNAFISDKNLKVKINSYNIEYSISKPLKKIIEIDVSKELIGVIQYLKKGTKKLIFIDGMIKENHL